MKRKKIELQKERQIITYMIVSSVFLRETAVMIKPKYFQSPYGRWVSEWILEYYKEFKEPPGKHIQDIYKQKSHFIRDEDELEIVGEFILKLSEEWEKVTKSQNIPYLVKEATKYLKIRSLVDLKEKLDLSISELDPVKGEQFIADYSRVDRMKSDGISILKDPFSIASAFMEEQERLFRFPGILGEVVGDFLRGDFVAFLAFAKRGKTWWQLYLASLGIFYGYRVAFFNLEMSEKKIIRRIWTSLTAQPRKNKKIILPYFEEIEDEEGKFEVLFKEEKRLGVSIEEIEEKQKKYKRQYRSGDIRMFTIPSYSCTVEEIARYVDNLEYYDNFQADIIIIDYADLLKSSMDRWDYRHQIDDIWKNLRKLSSEKNIMVVTASQAGRSASNQDATEEKIAEDIRKIAHVDKMISINMNTSDRKREAVRIAQLAERDGRRNYRQALVLQCLDIGRPYIDSRYVDDVEEI